MATIVFQVDLTTVNNFASKQPYNQYDSGINGNFKSTRVTWFPDQNLNNREKHNGDTFTVTGANAYYLLNNFCSGTFKFLNAISVSAI
jgi:hypothetical protein